MGTGAEGANGEEEGWERGSQVSTPGKAGMGTCMTPGALVGDSGGFRCMHSRRGQSVEPVVVGDRPTH